MKEYLVFHLYCSYPSASTLLPFPKFTSSGRARSLPMTWAGHLPFSFLQGPIEIDPTQARPPLLFFFTWPSATKPHPVCSCFFCHPSHLRLPLNIQHGASLLSQRMETGHQTSTSTSSSNTPKQIGPRSSLAATGPHLTSRPLPSKRRTRHQAFIHASFSVHSR